MIVRAVIKKQETLEFDIPERWAGEFETIEETFLKEEKPVLYSVLKRFASSKGFKLNPTY